MPPHRILIIGLLLLLPVMAAAHVNDRGMDYRLFKDRIGIPCCDNKDCHPAEEFTEVVENGKEVVRLLIDGLWITVPRAFVIGEQATDGRAHWCGMKLRTNSGRGWRPGTRCIILPPRVL